MWLIIKKGGWGFNIINIGEIINDSIRYPLSNRKTFLFLGLIVILGDLSSIFGTITKGLIVIFSILALLILFVRLGYQLRIMEFSIANNSILPELNKWKKLLINGLKVFIVTLIYIFPIMVVIIPLVMIIALTSYSSGANLADSNMFKTFGLVSILLWDCTWSLYITYISCNWLTWRKMGINLTRHLNSMQ